VTKRSGKRAQPKNRSRPPGNATAIPAAADLRPNFERWQLALRKTGARAQHLLGLRHRRRDGVRGRPQAQPRAFPLSVEFLKLGRRPGGSTARRDGHFFSSVIRGYEKLGICPEAEMPYAKKFSADYQPSEKGARRRRARVANRGAKVSTGCGPTTARRGLTDEHIAQTKNRPSPAGRPSPRVRITASFSSATTTTPALRRAAVSFFVRDFRRRQTNRPSPTTAAKERMCDLFLGRVAARENLAHLQAVHRAGGSRKSDPLSSPMRWSIETKRFGSG